MIYAIPIFISLFLNIFFGKNKYVFMIFIFFVSLFVSLRGDVSSDFYSYIGILNDSPDIYEYLNGGSDLEFEFLFVFLNVLVKTFGFGVTAIYVFYALITFSLIYKISVYFEKNYFLTFVIIYSFNFVGIWEQIRFGAVIAIVLWASILYSKNEIKKSLIYFLFSILIHNIGIVFLFLVLIYHYFYIFLNRKYIVFCLSLLIFVFLQYSNYGAQITEFMAVFNNRYSEYGDSSNSTGYKNVLSIYFKYIFAFIVILLIKDNESKNKNIFLFVFLYSMNLFFWNLAFYVDVLYRLALVSEIYFLFLVQLDFFKKGVIKYFLIFMLVIVCVARLVAGQNVLIDYRSIFSDDVGDQEIFRKIELNKMYN